MKLLAQPQRNQARALSVNDTHHTSIPAARPPNAVCYWGAVQCCVRCREGCGMPHTGAVQCVPPLASMKSHTWCRRGSAYTSMLGASSQSTSHDVVSLSGDTHRSVDSDMCRKCTSAQGTTDFLLPSPRIWYTWPANLVLDTPGIASMIPSASS